MQSVSVKPIASHPASPMSSGRVIARVPHPIPYKGSKRNLAPAILGYLPERVGTQIEPFAG